LLLPIFFAAAYNFKQNKWMNIIWMSVNDKSFFSLSSHIYGRKVSFV
jgi:hypothetical protein